ncbi:MAG: hypothetical protein FWC44_00195 [Methanomassiliicoccaceae archaeon]|nr:hypothetical protein [Methanomassiliicoccaceae archaeon]
MKEIDKKITFAFAVAAVAILAMAPATAVSTEGTASDVLKKISFGGSDYDEITSIITVPDGLVAVGCSYNGSFGNGDWNTASGAGLFDSFIVKLNNNGTVVWAENFGGSIGDVFYDVAATFDGGYVAVGYSDAFDGKWSERGITGNGISDATIVKFNNDGSVAWAKNFGGSGIDAFNSVTAVPDGVIAVGESTIFDMDWTQNGVTGKGYNDATIVKFNNDGSVAWAKNFGGSVVDTFKEVKAVSGGFVAVGYSEDFDGDWSGKGITGKGNRDATIVKFDNEGKPLWAKNFGGSDRDEFTSVTEVTGGYVAVGFTNKVDKDWAAKGVKAKGGYDATIVKFNIDGSVAWAKNFGGKGSDGFDSVIAVSGGFVAVGYSGSKSFGNGDWVGTTEKSADYDGTIVKFNNDGSVAWATNFGSTGQNIFNSVAAAFDGYVAAGSSQISGTDWAGVNGKGMIDGIIVKFDSGVVPVTDITGVPSSVVIGTDLNLIGTVVPSGASEKTVTWSLKDAGETGATLSGGTLSNTGVGNIIVTATVVDGTASGDFVKDFTITVKASDDSSGGGSSILWIGIIAVIAIVLIGAIVIVIKKKPSKGL